MLPNRRLPAIDCFRALAMYLMIFVNDVAGVINIPKWIGHTQAQEDGMGFADTIFPAFLFIVGLSLPHRQPARQRAIIFTDRIAFIIEIGSAYYYGILSCKP